jgi:hypothetical protein
MAHEDGPKYEPVVAILSLGAPAIFRFYEKPCPLQSDSENKPRAPALSLILPSKSLLVFRGRYYTEFLHGINAVEQEIVDSTVVNGHLFPRQLDVPEADEEVVKNGQVMGNDLEKKEDKPNEDRPWSFLRGGTRVSLTMRNGLHKIACLQL